MAGAERWPRRLEHQAGGSARDTTHSLEEKEMAKGRDKGGREPKKPKANKKAPAASESPFKQPAPPPTKGAAKKA
jgi:hypothetical protein